VSLLDAARYWARFEVGHLLTRSPKVRGWPAAGERAADAVQAALEAAGVPVIPWRVDVAEYHDFVRRADYARFPDYYAWQGPPFIEKSLEHYLAARLLDLRPRAVYVDVASDTSPAPEIYGRLYGVTAYRQDLKYPPGVTNDRIGGDAAAMPVGAGFADALALHCSFEHFEGDADMHFIRECARTLRPGGRVCIVPLYLHAHAAVLSDPGALRWNEHPTFDAGATVYSVRGWGERHGRLYDADALQSRILASLGPLQATVYRVTNLADVAPSAHLNFALIVAAPMTGPRA
jgi:SAM-dependent methyltransferase